MYIWTQDYGKETKVQDFAGRIIYKAAYGDENSEYGWNLDHIFPLSRGGKTVTRNLICSHIITNSEKGNSYPVFIANGKKFEIQGGNNNPTIVEKSCNHW